MFLIFTFLTFPILGLGIHSKSCRAWRGTFRHPGVLHGAGSGDPPAADGPRGHLPPHLLLPAAGRHHARQLRRAQDRRGAEGGEPDQGGGGALHHARGQDPRAPRAGPPQVHRAERRVQRRGLRLAQLPHHRLLGRHHGEEAVSAGVRGLHAARVHPARVAGPARAAAAPHHQGAARQADLPQGADPLGLEPAARLQEAARRPALPAGHHRGGQALPHHRLHPRLLRQPLHRGGVQPQGRLSVLPLPLAYRASEPDIAAVQAELRAAAEAAHQPAPVRARAHPVPGVHVDRAPAGAQHRHHPRRGRILQQARLRGTHPGPDQGLERGAADHPRAAQEEPARAAAEGARHLQGPLGLRERRHPRRHGGHRR